jgi:23S rRNA pseudouridine2605 synthase|tara:strand:+ start:140 stop:826 length:687 start_codon:yes stop_codon:yes gene_type:complete
MLERVQKIIARAGVCSRRNAEDLIKEGKVKVDGVTAKIGDSAEANKAIIEVNGKKIIRQKGIYILVNKPIGILSAAKDTRTKTIVDLVNCPKRIFPIGRLDKDSEGLMILTNDGEFANKIIHPRYNITKRYELVLNNAVSEEHIKNIKDGEEIDAKTVNTYDVKHNGRKVTLSIHEGRKHILKKLFAKLGYKIEFLKRIMIGNLKLNLKPGEFQVVEKNWLTRQIKDE